MSITTTYHNSDTGNAMRFADKFKAKVKFCPEWKSWLVFDGARYAVDKSGLAIELAKTVAEDIRADGYTTYASIPRDASKEERSSLAKAADRMLKYADTAEGKTAIKSMLELAQSDARLSTSAATFDTEPWLVICENGVLDLRTGELCDHDPALLLTKRIAVSFAKDAKAPNWKKFLKEVTCGDRELERFIQKAVGYSLTGQITEQCLFLLTGHGSNGKSTLINALQALFGDYGLTSQFNTFSEQDRKGKASPDLVRLHGMRFVSATEGQQNERMDESLIKQITGGDKLTARGLYQDEFEFYPTHKLWLATNHLPMIRGNDRGIWRRMRRIPFNASFEGRADVSLAGKLLEELPGILAWAVEGCLAWQQDGLETPESVRKATEEYQEAMDSVGTFLREECVNSPKIRIKSSELYGAYQMWAKANGEYQISNKVLTQRLDEKGFSRKRTGSGIVWDGLGLVADNAALASIEASKAIAAAKVDDDENLEIPF